MKLTALLAGSAALAAIAVAVPAAIAPSWSPVATAQAATSISVSLFYDRLDDHGDWVFYDDRYVFVPVIDDPDWRPYTLGHWVYAREYGWVWVSDEPFGWATYHYGRWGFDDDIGWYWVPGTRWGPAWVSWRRGGSHVAWAPLPHYRGDDDDVSISVSIDSIPDYYWVACPTRSFLEIDLRVVLVDDRERRRIVDDLEFAGHVKVENNIVVNNVIDVTYVEENTGKQVKEVEVKQVEDPAAAKASDEQVEVFNGTIEADKSAKPPEIKEVTEVQENQAEPKKKVKAESGSPAEAAPDDQAAQPGEEPPDKKKVETEQPDGQTTGTIEQTEKPAEKKPEADQTEGAAADTENAATPSDENRKKKVEESQTSAPAEQSAEPEAQPAQEKASGKKAKPEEAGGEEASQPEEGQPEQSQPEEGQPAPDEQPAQKEEKKDQAAPCDTAKENCAGQ